MDLLQSQAIKAGSHVWLSGQIPTDAEGSLIQGSMTEKAQTIIQNTEAVLKEAGSSLDNVVKVVVCALVLILAAVCGTPGELMRSPEGLCKRCQPHA